MSLASHCVHECLIAKPARLKGDLVATKEVVNSDLMVLEIDYPVESLVATPAHLRIDPITSRWTSLRIVRDSRSILRRWF
jgi:hypothetical protein